MPYKLSPSTLNIFTECPRCFWLQFRKGIKRPAGIFPSLPSGMDGVLKKHFDSYMEKSEMPPELSSLSGYHLFNNKEKLKIWRSNFKGLSFEDDSGNILRGAVDNILVKDKKLVVLDYKTRGFPVKDNTHEHYIQQMNIYNFLLRKMGYETEDYTYLLFYHPVSVRENGDVVFDAKLIKIKTDSEKGQEVWRNALNCLEGDIPISADGCEYCTYLSKF
ncbi:MAG: PD-(D/E)XK nuclease family protein [Candidatus Woesearchaeota archaeon]